MSYQALVRLAVLTAVVHIYLGLRLLGDLPVSEGVRLAAWGYLALSSAAIPAGFFSRRYQDRRLGDRLAWIGYLCMGFFSSLFVLGLTRDVALAGAWIASLLGVSVPLGYLARNTAIAVMGLSAFITVVGVVNARRLARVVRVTVPIRNLPLGLQGFTIAQISDVHVGPTIKRRYVEAIVKAVNALDADLVAVTGDVVDGAVRDLAAHVAPLGDLAARHGVYCVLGNHEYYSNAHAWTDAFRGLGLHVLINEGEVLRHGGARLLVAGVTDYGAHHYDPAHRSDPYLARRSAEPGDVCILLAHQPRSAAAAADAGFHLQLSGHTHGGQFLPWNFFVRLQQPFVAGLKRFEDLWVYVSRGTGYWGPPLRFGAPSEITLLSLQAA